MLRIFQKRIEEEKGEKQYHFDILTGEQIEGKHGKQYQEYRNHLDIAKQILEKCKTDSKRISLTKDELLWLRRSLEDKSSTDMWRNHSAHAVDNEKSLVSNEPIYTNH